MEDTERLKLLTELEQVRALNKELSDTNKKLTKKLKKQEGSFAAKLAEVEKGYAEFVESAERRISTHLKASVVTTLPPPELLLGPTLSPMPLPMSLQQLQPSPPRQEEQVTTQQPPLQKTAPTSSTSTKKRRKSKQEEIPLRAKRPDRGTDEMLAKEAEAAAAAAAEAEATAAKEAAAIFDRSASQKDTEMELSGHLPQVGAKRAYRGDQNKNQQQQQQEAAGGGDWDSEEDGGGGNDADFTRKFHDTVQRARAQKPYVSDFGKGLYKPADKPPRVVRQIEVVRKKDARAALPGFTCPECAKFFEAQVQQGIWTLDDLPEALRRCSKHKAKYKPPDTPEGVWGLTIDTPPEWRDQDKEKTRTRA